MGQFYLGGTALNQLWLGNNAINQSYGPVSITNAETQNWINATGIDNPDVWLAVDQFVSGLKTDNIWSKFRAIYPFITDSTTEAVIKDQFSKNLVNPNVHTLEYSGTSTVGYDGYENGGTNSFIGTNLRPPSSSITSATGMHLSFYSAEQFVSTEQGQIGAYWTRVDGVATITDGVGIFTTGSTQACCQFFGGGNSTSLVTVGGNNPDNFPFSSDVQILTNATGSGWWLSSLSNLLASPSTNTYLNGALVKSDNNLNTDDFNIDTPILLGTAGHRDDVSPNFTYPFGFSTLKYSFCTIGAYLNSTEAANANSRIQTLQQQIDAIFSTSRAV